MRLVKGLMVWLACVLSLSPALAAPDWTRVVTATPAGGYLIGNPAAPVKVIEYFSLTCPHCRHFAETGMPALRSAYLARGKVSLELRNFVFNAPDMAASLLMRCGTPAQAVRLFDAAFADQEKLFAGAHSLRKDAADRIGAVPLEQRPAALAREAGIDKWFISRGVPARRAAACLVDAKRERQLVDLRQQAAKNEKVEGTPSFLVNGILINGSGWEDLEPAINKALGG